MFRWRIVGLRNLLAICPEKGISFSDIAHPEKNVLRLADPRSTSDRVDNTYPFCWFACGLSCLTAMTDLLTALDARSHLLYGLCTK